MDGYPEFILEPSAIAEMQNRYTKNLNKVLKRINELKKLILFSPTTSQSSANKSSAIGCHNG